MPLYNLLTSYTQYQTSLHTYRSIPSHISTLFMYYMNDDMNEELVRVHDRLLNNYFLEALVYIDEKFCGGSECIYMASFVLLKLLVSMVNTFG